MLVQCRASNTFFFSTPINKNRKWLYFMLHILFCLAVHMSKVKSWDSWRLSQTWVWVCAWTQLHWCQFLWVSLCSPFFLSWWWLQGNQVQPVASHSSLCPGSLCTIMEWFWRTVLMSLHQSPIFSTLLVKTRFGLWLSDTDCNLLSVVLLSISFEETAALSWNAGCGVDSAWEVKLGDCDEWVWLCMMLHIPKELWTTILLDKHFLLMSR